MSMPRFYLQIVEATGPGGKIVELQIETGASTAEELAEEIKSKFDYCHVFIMRVLAPVAEYPYHPSESEQKR